MMQRLSDGVRADKTLSALVQSSSQWEHLWTLYQPPASSKDEGTPLLPDLEPSLKKQVDSLRNQVKTLQSQRDRAVAEATRFQSKGGGKAGEEIQASRVAAEANPNSSIPIRISGSIIDYGRSTRPCDRRWSVQTESFGAAIDVTAVLLLLLQHRCRLAKIL